MTTRVTVEVSLGFNCRVHAPGGPPETVEGGDTRTFNLSGDQVLQVGPEENVAAGEGAQPKEG